MNGPALRFLTNLCEGSAPWCVPIVATTEFLRVVTHPTFAPTSRLDQAFGFLKKVIEAPSCQILNPGNQFSAILERISDRAAATGNLIFDAAIVAVCIEHGVREIVTENRDFMRFEEIKTTRLAR